MLDDLYHHKLSSLTADWARDSFAPIPAFVDTGSSLVDKTNVDALIAASKIRNQQRRKIGCNHESGESGCERLCCCFFFLSEHMGSRPPTELRLPNAPPGVWPARPVAAPCFLFASDEAEGPNDLYGYRPDDNFFYLSGWSEPGAALLIMPATAKAGTATHRSRVHGNSVSSQPQSIPGEMDRTKARARTIPTPARLPDSTTSKFSIICARS